MFAQMAKAGQRRRLGSTRSGDWTPVAIRSSRGGWWAEALPVPLRGFADLVTGQAYFITVTKPVDLPFPPCPSPQTEGLVAWYPFDGNANDASGHGWNGTVLGPTLDADRFGRPGSCRWRSSHRWQGC